MRRRLDVELVRRGLAPSRTRAAEAIAAGRVSVRGLPATTSARQVDAAEAIVLADDPSVFFTTPHFDGYAAVLVQLEKIGLEDLREVIVEAWLARAPKRLAQSYLDSSL